MIQRLVLWGGRRDLDSLRHIWRAFANNAAKLGIHVDWVDDAPPSNDALTPGTTVIAADVWAQYLEPRPEVDYVLHNFNSDHPVCRVVVPEHILRLQVWTDDALGESWATCRSYYPEGRILFQPWGTDLLAEEFLDPIYNPHTREVVYVGAIWSDTYQGTELGNEEMIHELRLVLADFGLRLMHYTHISDGENVRLVRGARIAPAFAGGWQVAHNYVPCRGFKNISYGALGITNVPKFKEILDGCSIPHSDLADIVRYALSLRSHDYLELVREQQKKIAAYSYRESLEAISRALEEGR